MVTERRCAECRKIKDISEFPYIGTTNKLHKYCADCIELLAQMEKDEAEEKARKMRKKKAKSIDAILAECKRLGISYGEYSMRETLKTMRE